VADPIRFYFDPACPWCYQTSRWARRLVALGELSDIDWRTFSLEIVNLEDASGSGKPPAGGVTTGFGGTAPRGPGSPVPWLAVIGAGSLLALTGGLRMRRDGLRSYRKLRTGI
jgi:hypothetical protein